MVHPDTRTIDVYSPGQGASTLHEDDSLGGQDIFPGFTCQLSAVVS